jgi:hypothetical protein
LLTFHAIYIYIYIYTQIHGADRDPPVNHFTFR